MRNLLFAVATALAVAGHLPAQINWIVNPENGHGYALTAALGWADAEAHAVGMGAHLVTIRSQAEQAWIYQTFGTELLWIGFSDQGVEGNWTWTSGEPVTYTHWCPGEPNNASNEDFANLSGCGGWNDVEDTILIPGIMETSSPAGTYTPFGSGCTGPNGLAPDLAGVPGEVPRPGTTSHVRVTNLPLAVTIPVFVVGFSDTWDPDGYPLPLDLGIIGWTGCPQLVSDEILYWSITTAGQADQPITIPAGYPLGFTFHVQALVLYTPTGVALSNAVTGVVGY